MSEAIVTYGEDWSVGKEMLRRALIARYCACCRARWEPKEGDTSWECEECRNDDSARSAYTT